MSIICQRVMREKKAEISRLRAERDEAREWAGKMIRERDELREQVDRMRTEAEKGGSLWEKQK